ncbi:MAG: Smr/MutS family protein [Methyloceanibacter sp.]|uniref:Smr/MutS family protein n=1 Tax=Methyloceanibacter sp. TaxID=1965321 RepID=UPI001D76AA24|nr:Smr/MutS family protein [Methyloceanibacter sp.]MCB1443673.1 Smr/MutS family protein [Methyloceanibacter sp.]
MANDRSDKAKRAAGKKRGSIVSLEDDAALWARVAETAKPLMTKNRALYVDAQLKLPPKPKPAKSEGEPQAAHDVMASALPMPEPQSRVTVKKVPSPTAGLDRQTSRRLDKGALAIEARIDLHGMRQREAHVALRKFLHWARGKDYRHVLVITGKGSLRDEGRSFYDEDVRGVLRQTVPHWLAHGDLAPLIVSFSEAPRRLGGEGALYVRLRRGK